MSLDESSLMYDIATDENPSHSAEVAELPVGISARRFGIRLPISFRWFSLFLAAIGLSGCDSERTSTKPTASSSPQAVLYSSPEVSRAAVVKLCGHCHLFPEPKWLTKKSWRDAIIDMSKMSDYKLFYPDRPSTEDVINWYVERAPAEATVPESVASVEVRVGEFEKTSFPQISRSDNSFGISSIQEVVFSEESPSPQILVGNMQTGDVLTIDATDREVREIGRLNNPARLNVVDLDGDGLADVLAAELGAPLPQDHNLGEVIWLRQLSSGKFDSIVLCAGLGRVADVQAADFDDDGDLDLIVAEFGWRITGHVLLLENQTVDWSAPQFRQRIVDGRNGAVSIECLDLNEDGRQDFVALIAQGHEMLVAYLNQGDFRFEVKIMHRAPHPAWGYCALDVVDLDQDGDIDFILGNGDTLDNSELKAFYEIAWLENLGADQFEYHSLTQMFGVMALEAGDLDGDGDLDIAAAAFTAAQVSPELSLPSLLWLEQKEGQFFERHVLELNRLNHLSLAVDDFDGDGRNEITLGNGRGLETDSAIELWSHIGTNIER